MTRRPLGDDCLKYVQLRSKAEALETLIQIGVDPYGVEAMSSKMSSMNILIEEVECKIANIIKQEMLSLGGDAAVSRNSVSCSVKATDVLIIGTVKQILRFADKLSNQPFGLMNLSSAIKRLIEHISRDIFTLRTNRRKLIIGERTLIMGILNVTPDSFSDGGRYQSYEDAIEHGLKMVEDGADIVDVGGESSRPGAGQVSADEEMKRVIPVIRELSKRVKVPISVDTTKASVAREAIVCGAEIINDISAMTFDDQMLPLIAKERAASIFMHMRGKPTDMQTGDLSYRSLRGDIIHFLKERIREAQDFGIDTDSMMIDPGFGFGKTGQDNLKLLKYLVEFKTLGKPIVAGVSRKAFIGHITGGNPEERKDGTAAAVTAAITNGANVIRVHDVKEMKNVAAVIDAVLRA